MREFIYDGGMSDPNTTMVNDELATENLGSKVIIIYDGAGCLNN